MWQVTFLTYGFHALRSTGPWLQKLNPHKIAILISIRDYFRYHVRTLSETELVEHVPCAAC